MAQWIKDLAVLQLWLRFNPWLRNFHMPPKGKKKRSGKKKPKLFSWRK